MSLPSDFDHNIYLELNTDLKRDASIAELEHHYINYGRKEGRQYTTPIPSNVHILVVVVSCNKHIHLWESLTNRTSSDLVIISGTNDRNKERYYDKEKKVLWLNCNDYYDGLPEKIILMIEHILKNPEFSHITHILKIDDHDTFFNDKNIKNLHTYRELQKFDYLGQKLNCWKGHNNCSYHFGKVPEWSEWHNKTADVSNITYFDGGCSYILSRKAMEMIHEEYNDSNIDQLRRDEIYEDVMIGRILINKKNVSYKELNYGILGDK
jgi:hypothetical protein